jgi:hypothetical protein
MKPESFSRALGKLRSHGVTVEREVITVADVGHLLSFIEYAHEDSV